VTPGSSTWKSLKICLNLGITKIMIIDTMPTAMADDHAGVDHGADDLFLELGGLFHEVGQAGQDQVEHAARSPALIMLT
jgi:hypothetical protein